MKKLPFKTSSVASLGIELEIQLINPSTFDMNSDAKILLQNLKASPISKYFKPEITQSMIEINSGVHTCAQKMYEELINIRNILITKGDALKIAFCGGGTHPFQKWVARKIFPTPRFKNLSRIYQYLSKQSTVFGEHIHIGCASAEEAIYLTHALGYYVPQLIAICASSPYYQGVDTGFASSRTNLFNVYPMSGVIPYVLNWQEFCEYYYKMRNYGIIKSMKDFYWDIRPKPEFGTVEIRVCDTPLTIKTAVVVAAFAQSLALYLVQEKPLKLNPDLYVLYNYNRFQAVRYGLLGSVIDPVSKKRRKISDEILTTLELIDKYTAALNNQAYLKALTENVKNYQNDAALMRQTMKQVKSLAKLVQKNCRLFETG